jgi:PTS system cellobiose-specific IIC component
MKAFMNWIENTLAPRAAKLSEQRHLAAVRDGLILLMSFMIIGSFAVLILNIPIKGWADLTVIKYFKPYGLPVWNGTLGIVGLLAAFSIGSALAQRLKMDGTMGGLLAAASLVVISPDLTGAWGLPFHTAGWLFTAMFTALIAVEIQHWFVKNKIVIKMPDSVPPAVGRSFSALIPAIGVLFFFSIVRGIFQFGLGMGVNDVVGVVLAPLKFFGGSLAGALVAVILVHLLWAVGIHGGNIALAIFGPVFLVATNENVAAFSQGLPVHNIVTGPFLDIFVYFGGAGATLGLALVMFLFARSKQLKTLGRISIGPALFNINEPLIFGTPIIMNPMLLIPFLGIPVVLTIISYFVMATNIVGRTIALAPWTSPVIMGALYATADWKAVILQLFNVALATAIYYPFFKAYDKQKVAEENGAVSKAA